MTKPSAPLPDDVWVSYDPDNQYASNELCLYGPHKSLPSVRYVRASPQVPPELRELLSLLRRYIADNSADSALEREFIRDLDIWLDASPPRAAGADAILCELVACKDLADELEQERLYGKPHEQAHKNKELDYRQRKIEAWRAAREYLAQSRGPTEGAECGLHHVGGQWFECGCGYRGKHNNGHPHRCMKDAARQPEGEGE